MADDRSTGADETAPVADGSVEEPPATTESAASTAAAGAAADEAAAAELTDGSAAAPAAEPSARAPRGTRAARPAKPTRAKTTAERGTYVRTPPTAVEQGVRRHPPGVVTSDKGEKTITVRVDVMKQHPKYKKIQRRSIKLRAHDEANAAKVGDTVRIAECRPMSRTKRWRLVEVVEVAR